MVVLRTKDDFRVVARNAAMKRMQSQSPWETRPNSPETIALPTLPRIGIETAAPPRRAERRSIASGPARFTKATRTSKYYSDGRKPSRFAAAGCLISPRA
jgi:hypothetical protein